MLVQVHIILVVKSCTLILRTPKLRFTQILLFSNIHSQQVHGHSGQLPIPVPVNYQQDEKFNFSDFQFSLYGARRTTCICLIHGGARKMNEKCNQVPTIEQMFNKCYYLIAVIISLLLNLHIKIFSTNTEFKLQKQQVLQILLLHLQFNFIYLFLSPSTSHP